MILTIEADTVRRLYELTKGDQTLARALAAQFVERIGRPAIYSYLLDEEKMLQLLTDMMQQEPEKTLTELQQLAEGKAVSPADIPVVLDLAAVTEAVPAVEAEAAPEAAPKVRKKPGPKPKLKGKPGPKPKGKPGPKPKGKPGPKPKAKPAEAEVAKPKRGPGRPRKVVAVEAAPEAKPAKQRKEAAKAAVVEGDNRRRFAKEDVESIKAQIVELMRVRGWVSRADLDAVVEIPTQSLYRRIISEMKDAGQMVQQGTKSRTTYGLGAAVQEAAPKAKGGKKGRSA